MEQGKIKYYEAVDQFRDQIEDAIEEALKKGLPEAEILGILEVNRIALQGTLDLRYAHQFIQQTRINGTAGQQSSQ